MASDPKTPGWLLAVSACAVLLAEPSQPAPENDDGR